MPTIEALLLTPKLSNRAADMVKGLDALGVPFYDQQIISVNEGRKSIIALH